MANGMNLSKADPLETLLYERQNWDGTNLADALLRKIWGVNDPSIIPIHRKVLFLDTYEAHILLLDRTRVAIDKHQHVVDLVDYVLAENNAKVLSIKHELTALPWLGSSLDAPSVALGLVLELLMIGRDSESWKDDYTLKENIAKTFRTPSMPLASNDLGIDFDTKHLERTLGIQIMETDSLSDHLLFDPSRRVLWLFSQDAFLKHYSNTDDR